MKHSLFLYLLIFVPNILFSQKNNRLEKGEVTFVSSQNIYVGFESTQNIEIGDTLFAQSGTSYVPILLVSNKSSISCVCNPLDGINQIKKGDAFFTKVKTIKEKINDPFAPIENDNEADRLNRVEEVIEDDLDIREDDDNPFKQKINGRISAASYSNMGDRGDLHRMRYGFRFRGDNINNSRFSFENNIVFRHTQGEWNEVQNNFADALKIYSLSATYDFSESSHITLGRKINPKISSLGAIDGLQFEKSFGQFTVGAIAGSRPDFADFSFNPNLLQMGAFVSHVAQKKYGLSTLGFAEQRNGGAIDRRFVYFQHSSNPVKNLNLFTSFEVDLFENINEQVNSQPKLTNLYASLRYRFSRKFSISASYDTRRNIIFYESYKSFIENLIDQETRQGLRVGVSIRPMKYVTIGANASWRFQKSDINVSRNLSGYLNIGRLPGINSRLSLRANLLQTNYLDSRIFGARLSKDIIKGKLSGDIYYRLVEYKYQSSEFMIRQHIGGASLNIRLAQKTSLSLYGERTFDDDDRNLMRINAKIIKRF